MDLIDRAKLLNIIKNELAYQEKHATPGEDIDTGIICGLGQAVEIVKGIEPSAEKTGKWEITDAFPHIVYCGVCHKRYAQTSWQVWKDGTLPRSFCPSCGARMVE